MPPPAAELPHTLTGTLMGRCPGLPPPTEPLPLVDQRSLWLGTPLTAAPPSHPAAERPRRLTALPQTSTGMLIGALIWLPPPIQPSPLVDQVPAMAIPVPGSANAALNIATLAAPVAHGDIFIPAPELVLIAVWFGLSALCWLPRAAVLHDPGTPRLRVRYALRPRMRRPAILRATAPAIRAP